MEFFDRVVGLIFVLSGILVLIDQFGLYKFNIMGLETLFVAALLVILMEVYYMFRNVVSGNKSPIRMIITVVILLAAGLYFVQGIIPENLVGYLGILYGMLLIIVNFGVAM